MNSEKTIDIKCNGSKYLDIKYISRFQGDLKKRTKKQIENLIMSIKKYGFSAPIFIWVNNGINHCIDGHGRLLALEKMQKEGYVIPLLPCVEIESKTREEAKNKLLRITSQYGKISGKGLTNFMEGEGDVLFGGWED